MRPAVPALSPPGAPAVALMLLTSTGKETMNDGLNNEPSDDLNVSQAINRVMT
jgi:hypothetical protein